MARSAAQSRKERMIVFIRALHYRYEAEPAEMEFVIRSLRRGDTAIDAGAFVGGFTYWMHRAVGATGRVFAFEPQRECGPALRRMKRSFRMANVTLSHLALSSRSGEREFFVQSKPPWGGATLVPRPEKIFRSYRVRTTTLDSYLARHPAPRVGLIKCDVEGHESAVIEGARGTLERDRPILLVEREQRHIAKEPMAAVFEFLEQLGYRGYGLFRGRTIAARTFLSAHHENYYRREYVNNFIFVPQNGQPLL